MLQGPADIMLENACFALSSVLKGTERCETNCSHPGENCLLTLVAVRKVKLLKPNWLVALDAYLLRFL